MDGLINDTVANAQSVEVKSYSGNGTVADKIIVLVEQIIVRRSIMPEKRKKRLANINGIKIEPELSYPP